MNSHIKALQTAQECVRLGARIRTIALVTGLEHYEISNRFFDGRMHAPRGRPPDSADWYYSANLASQAECCVFVAHYKRLKESGFSPADALIAGYKHYLSIFTSPRIPFDRAFDLASHFDGRWIAHRKAVDLFDCGDCGCQFIAVVGTTSSEQCPFCKLIRRFPSDPRIQAFFPLRDTDLPAEVIAMLLPSSSRED